ncbi:MAG: hypothetical protein DA328_04090 [Nitrososphaeraceae archaeon]|nr:hypothetical protein [Nitrososphaeraceae archaeon]
MIVYIGSNVYASSIEAIEFNININKHTSKSNNSDDEVLCIGKSGTIISSNVDDYMTTSVIDINNENKTALLNRSSFHFSQ